MANKSNAAKEEILIESFDILKENLDKHDGKMKDIIGKMAAINIDLAVEMWKYLIANGKSIIKENGYLFTGGVIYEIKEKTGIEKIVGILKDNEDILEACYGISSDIDQFLISDALNFGEVELADKLFRLTKDNKFKDASFAEILEEVCEYFVNNFEDIQTFDEDWDDKEEHDQKVAIASEGSSMLLKWVKTITNKEQKARLNVTLIDYV
ncbi:hypothetical protein MHB67_03400 [Bacillus sp. FSL H8-0516]|uniref:hypothetical protein n=1 Tax=Bacillus sp. FSL H8-0516 TaxID=2921397 RepID=UPI000CCC9973|nr:hypothetical protein C1954_11375 [Bacillus stratosphericus]